MDPELQRLAVELGEVALRNTAGAVADRIRTAKAKKKDRATIAELEEIISELVSDKNELTRIAQAYEEELVAQRISQSDIEYITANFVPLLKQLIEKAAERTGEEASNVHDVIDIVQPILSVETVTVLQLLGFNFRKGVGEPLTQLLARLIQSRSPGDTEMDKEIQKLNLRREIAYLEIAQDPEAHARLTTMLTQPS